MYVEVGWNEWCNYLLTNGMPDIGVTVYMEHNQLQNSTCALSNKRLLGKHVDYRWTVGFLITI